ncbi:MAG: DNA recombination protein RmuC [Sphaerochaeta sp.]|jgi:DNA recombination protein RmuC|nr:DNA recombination protein RmuC [Sphaerochaeta sp.]MCH3920370.1 DNA recombination protein RmuC [Sphaerochaeta sp.]MCI2046053.1 DNA recombination protein RmuC [Sphaerochaeta sp.]MCI2076149.1 DNA recombination protein RmuC [Sphaerochaeta sp.]MCI2105073.1 DNA recombination protein RmuC [Sphaerochaeta sp.]
MEYLFFGLLGVVIVLLLILVFRSGHRTDTRETAYLKASLDQLSRENSQTRKELLDMLEQYRFSVTQSVTTLQGQVSSALDRIRADNDAKLELMRQSVDTRLKSSLSESFSLVSQQLNEVHKGLGEMQNLASGVGDLKRLMGNIKSRGVLGEVQAKRILDDILTPGQYDTNVVCKKGSSQYVEFAVKMPGAGSTPVYLPIDCKFPKEDYERLMDAQDKADKEGVRVAEQALRTRLLSEGKAIAKGYLDPPNTTDFALLFLPSEGLYAEVLHLPGLAEELQLQDKVVVAGPTTLAAILNSLQMGFRTLAIEKRTDEVWKILSEVKTLFARFSEDLETTHKRITQAASSLDEVSRRTETMGRKLRDVEVLDTHTMDENTKLPENTV